jgi:hypothetical protein
VLLEVRDKGAAPGEGLNESFGAEDVQGMTDGTARYPMLSHQVRLGWDCLAWLELAGFDRTAQDRCQLGGKDHYQADRRAAEEVIRHRPQVMAGTRANRAFLSRVVGFLAAECGIRQFLDIGTGLPAPENTHEIAQAIGPDSRIVYVDNDPLVLVHARALLTSTAQGSCDYVEADLRDTRAVVAGAARTLDFTRPAAVLLLAVLHFIADSDDPAGIVAALASNLAPGSLLVISHLTGDFAPEPVAAGVAAYNSQVPIALIPRSHAQVSGLFGGLPLVSPGVVPLIEWRSTLMSSSTKHADMYAGVACIPRQHRHSYIAKL